MLSPDVRNYTVGKGIPAFRETGQSEWRDLGNVATFEFTPAAEALDHFSTRSGLRKKDRSVTISVEGELVISMEEWTIENLRMVLLGDITTDSDGNQSIDMLQRASIEGSVRFTMANEIGQQYEWIFNRVSFSPSSAISPLSDEWGAFQATGQVLADQDGKFGTVTHIGGEGFGESDSESSV